MGPGLKGNWKILRALLEVFALPVNCFYGIICDPTGLLKEDQVKNGAREIINLFSRDVPSQLHPLIYVSNFQSAAIFEIILINCPLSDPFPAPADAGRG